MGKKTVNGVASQKEDRMKGYLECSALKTAVPYFGVTAAGFYLLPLCIQDTGSGMVVLLVALPVLCFCAALVYAVKRAPALWYVIGVPLLFMPTAFLFYGSDMEALAFYSIGYALIAAVGHIVGVCIRFCRRLH